MNIKEVIKGKKCLFVKSKETEIEKIEKIETEFIKDIWIEDGNLYIKIEKEEFIFIRCIHKFQGIFFISDNERGNKIKQNIESFMKNSQQEGV